MCVCERERERERERETDGSDVTVVALKLAMSLHSPLPKNLHFSFLPSQMVTIEAPMKFAMSSRFALSVATLSNCATSDQRPQTKDRIYACPVLDCFSIEKK